MILSEPSAYRILLQLQKGEASFALLVQTHGLALVTKPTCIKTKVLEAEWANWKPLKD